MLKHKNSLNFNIANQFECHMINYAIFANSIDSKQIILCFFLSRVREPVLSQPRARRSFKSRYNLVRGPQLHVFSSISTLFFFLSKTDKYLFNHLSNIGFESDAADRSVS